MPCDTDRYRVFISYSHDDRPTVGKIDAILRASGLAPKWDRDFKFGTGFPQQIRMFIAHAHVFLPVITEASSTRGWVHQEIGYAKALNVPMMPLVVGKALPDEAMMRDIHALLVDEDLTGLEHRLSPATFENLVRRSSDPQLALYECAELMQDRTRMMAEYAESVRDLGEFGRVRQKGALSSFHIPDKRIGHRAWADRYGGQDRGEHHCRLLRRERKALAEHAEACGCRITIDPSLEYRKYGPSARKVRLETLIEFLESPAVADVQIAVNPAMPASTSITFVGDWFSAEAVSGAEAKGYEQTIFTRHAPSMRARIQEFDSDFEELLEERGWTPESSRGEAVKLLREIVDGIKA